MPPMLDGHPALAGRMTGRCALVTGASSGIGRSTALMLAREGASVALLALPQSGVEEVASACQQHGAEAMGIEADVGDPRAVDEGFALAEAELGPLDAVYCGAGVSAVVSAAATTDAVWERQLRTNLAGTFHVLRAAARVMIPRGRGAIVTTGSELALTGQAGYVAYSASKGGVLAMTRALAAELAPHSIRINAVCPGTVDTPLLAAEFETADDPVAERRATEDSIALGRIARPEEIARLVVFLLSDESSYVTGTEFVADGGRTGCYPTAGAPGGTPTRERHEVST